MSFEVDIHKVGDESQSGDAISLRYGDFSHRDRFRVVVIDGGFLDTGELVVAHIKKYYGTEKADLVVSTHPDNDHSSGLRVILEKLTVGQFWIHRLSTRKSRVGLLLEAAARSGGEARKLLVQESIATVTELEDLADKKGIPIVEPFAGTSIDNRIYVLGPSEQFYADLFAGGDEKLFGRVLLEAVRKAKKWIKERWDKDALEEPAENATSPRNNSSTILLARVGSQGQDFLFTADAGVAALTSAADYATAVGYDIAANVKYFQSPHHGSKRNVGPALLDRLLGTIVEEGATNGKKAFISAAKKGEPKHPSKRVTNALIRRGLRVYATQGSTHCYHSDDVSARDGWSALTPVSFAENYEEEED